MCYSRSFYQDRHSLTAGSARRILGVLLDTVPGVGSAVDLGCGVGTWLGVAAEMGVGDVAGYDGPWVDRDLLKIDPIRFHECDLREPIKPQRRFDLALSLEVAEHLPPWRAEGFVSDLTSLSDVVLFGAAIPGQGGEGHLNERWQSYWAGQFLRHGYVPVDIIRPRIWQDEEVFYWYRQNTLLYIAQPRLEDIRCAQAEATEFDSPLDLVHPCLFTEVCGKIPSPKPPLRSSPSIRTSLRFLRQAVAISIRRRLSIGSGTACDDSSREDP